MWLYRSPTGAPTISHDGVTVAEGIELPEADDETLSATKSGRPHQANRQQDEQSRWRRYHDRNGADLQHLERS